MSLFIICGHGDGDPGAVGNGYQEAERVRALADRIRYFGGDSVIIGDTSKNWYKSKLVNNKNIPSGSKVLELHMDSGSENARGGHIIIDADFVADEYDKALAEFIGAILPGRSEKIAKRNNIANLNRAQLNSINYRLLECGFISNAEDVQVFNGRMDDIAKGIVTCFGIRNAKVQDVNGDGKVDANDALEILKKTANIKPNPEGYDANDALNVLKQTAGSVEKNNRKTKTGVINGSGVRIRKGPGTGYAVVGSTTKGQKVTVWKEENGWCMVDLDKWVSGKYVSII